VFAPVGLMPGIAGQFFKQFGFTVVAAVLMSLAVARLITPMIAAYFLKSHGVASHGEGWMMDRYMGLLRWSLVHRWKTVLLGALAFAATVVAFATLPLTFQPTQDNSRSSVTIEMPPGTTLAQTAAVADEAERIVKTAPEVEKVVQRVSLGSARLNVTLREDRERTSVEFERALSPQLTSIADARVNFQSQSGGGSGRDMTITLGGDDPVQLNQAAQAVVDDMAKMPELRAPRINGDLLRPEIVIKPRLDLAADLGVTTSALSQAIRIATLGEIDQNSAKFSLSDRQIPIRVSLDEGSRRNLSTIQNLPVPTTSGGSVPLKVVADIGFGAGPSVIQRNNQTRRITIGADLAPGLVSGDARPKIYALPSMKNLPQGIRELKLGESKWQAELLVNFLIAVASGIMLVFAVLVLLYKRIMPPLVNLGSLLLAPLGAGLALHITGDAVSMPVFIGLLMLLGIVAKNSILLIDFALEEMNKGVEKVVAITDAGHKRAQPIVMTTVAMVAGMVPTALALSGDSSWRAPMGVTVIGGLIVSTILTLIIVPASFSLAIDFEKWLGRRFSRIVTYDGVEPRHPDAATQPAE
jgi:multidrug efflux pump subunit AcrB